jgi:hypothetical protein
MLINGFSPFLRMPESIKINRLDPGLRRGEELR